MKLTKFEDIEAWQEARKLTNVVYKVSKQGAFGKDYGLKDQIQGSSNSIMANIAEGFDSQSNPEFVKFLGYALRSASEVQSHLYVALDQGYLDKQQFDGIYQQAVTVKRLILGFIRYLRSSNYEPRTMNLEP